MLKLMLIFKFKWKNVFVQFTFCVLRRACTKLLSRTSPKRRKLKQEKWSQKFPFPLTRLSARVNFSYKGFFKKLQSFGRGHGDPE